MACSHGQGYAGLQGLLWWLGNSGTRLRFPWTPFLWDRAWFRCCVKWAHEKPKTLPQGLQKRCGRFWRTLLLHNLPGWVLVHGEWLLLASVQVDRVLSYLSGVRFLVSSSHSPPRQSNGSRVAVGGCKAWLCWRCIAHTWFLRSSNMWECFLIEQFEHLQTITRLWVSCRCQSHFFPSCDLKGSMSRQKGYWYSGWSHTIWP